VNTPLCATLRAKRLASQQKRAVLRYEHTAPAASDHLRSLTTAGGLLPRPGRRRIDQPADEPHHRVSKNHKKDKPEQHRN